jgi:MFS family permease
MNKVRGFWRVGFLLGMIMVAANVPTPIYALYAIPFHFGPALLAAIFATYVVFLIPSLLFWGQWSDQRGRKPALWPWLSFAVLSTMSFLFGHQVLWLFVGRAAQGIGAGILSDPATTQWRSWTLPISGRRLWLD